MHTRIKSAIARIEATETVKTYGNEARGEFIPALHELRGVREDAGVWKPAGKGTLKYIGDRLTMVETYLQGLVDEYMENYAEFSKLSVEEGWASLTSSPKMQTTQALVNDRVGDDSGEHYKAFAVPMHEVRTKLLA